MTDLSTELREQAIIFKDNSVAFVSNEIGDKIMELSFTDTQNFRLPNGHFIAINSISQILSIDEYYQQYPDKRPPDQATFQYEPKAPWKLAKSLRAIEQFIGGYERYKVETYGQDKWEQMKANDLLYAKMLKTKAQYET